MIKIIIACVATISAIAFLLFVQLHPQDVGLVRIDGKTRTLVSLYKFKGKCKDDGAERLLVESFNKTNVTFSCIQLLGWIDEARRQVGTK